MNQSSSYAIWQTQHQPFELAFHRGYNFRWDDQQWYAQWGNVFARFARLAPETFSVDDTLIDVGCGSRPALQWFTAGRKLYLDPLIDEYRRIPQVADYWDGAETVCQPAEERHEALVDIASLVLCWNVLDHTYDWRAVLRNALAYARSEATIIIGTDLSAISRPGHPGMGDGASATLLETVVESCNILRESGPCYRRDLALLLRKR